MIIPHHETFSTAIQPPYSSTKGWSYNGGQEPGDAAEIKECAAGFGATFPLFAKVEVTPSLRELRPAAPSVAAAASRSLLLKVLAAHFSDRWRALRTLSS
jgi:hypothetical protein